jgi:hypothetical protein
MIDPITKIIGTGDENIKIIQDFMDYDDWKILTDFAKSIDGNFKTKDHHVYQPLPGDINDVVMKYRKIIIDNAKLMYNLDFIDDGNQLCFYVHPEGSSMIPHTDVVIEERTGYIDYNDLDSIRGSHKDVQYGWTGHLANLIYLNDNYEGGEIYFPERNISIKPKPRMLIAFPGNVNYLHGVSENKNATRFNLSLFIKFKDFV